MFLVQIHVHTCSICAGNSIDSTSDLGMPCTRNAGQSANSVPLDDIKSGLKPSLSNIVLTGTHCTMQKRIRHCTQHGRYTDVALQ
jgi:hypothetical protein